MNKSKLKSVFLKQEVKGIIELNMNLKGIPNRNDALVDMLKESKRYNELINMLSQFNTPQQSVALSDSGENSLIIKSDDVLELSKKSVDELINEETI